MGNQESSSAKAPEHKGERSQIQQKEQWKNLEKKSPEKTKKRRRPDQEEEWKNLRNENGEDGTKELKYVLRGSYIKHEDDAINANQNGTQHDKTDEPVRVSKVNTGDASPTNEKEISYVIRRSYIKHDDDDSDKSAIYSKQNDNFHMDKSDAQTIDTNNTHKENHKNQKNDAHITCSAIPNKTHVKPSSGDKAVFEGHDSSITPTKCDVHTVVDNDTQAELKTDVKDIPKSRQINANTINNKETSTIKSKSQLIKNSEIVTEKEKVSVDQSTLSDPNTTTADATPCGTTIDTSFESKGDTVYTSDDSDESHESSDSDSFTETFHLMTIRRIELNPIVNDNVNSNSKSRSLPNMSNQPLAMLRPKPITGERKLKCRTLPIAGQRTKNTSYDNVRYYSSLETVLEDNGDNHHQGNETEQSPSNITRTQEYDDNYLSDHYDNVSLDSLTNRPKLYSQNGDVHIHNETDDNKIQKELIDRHRKTWLYKYNYEDLSRRNDRYQRPRRFVCYRSTNSLDSYLNHHRSKGHNHPGGYLGLSYDILDRIHHHGGYVNCDGVFVSHERKPSWQFNDDPGNTSDSSMSALDTDGYFVSNTNTVRRPPSYDQLFSKTDANRHDQTCVGDDVMDGYDVANGLYTTIEETRQSQNENLYQEVSEVSVQQVVDHPGTIKTFENATTNERTLMENKNGVKVFDNAGLSSVNDALQDDGIKSGNETDVDNCCGCGSNSKVKSR